MTLPSVQNRIPSLIADLKNIDPSLDSQEKYIGEAISFLTILYDLLNEQEQNYEYSPL